MASKLVSFQGEDLHLSYLPEFRSKTELDSNPLPRPFLVKSLTDFVGDVVEELSQYTFLGWRSSLQGQDLSLRALTGLSTKVL